MREPTTPTGASLYRGAEKDRPIRIPDILAIESEAAAAGARAERRRVETVVRQWHEQREHVMRFEVCLEDWCGPLRALLAEPEDA